MKISFQKTLYSSAMLLAPFVTTPPFLFFKRGREQICDRYGFWNLKFENSLWLHGASLGEMVGLSNIAGELKKEFPNLPLVASCTSPTGLTKARDFADASKLLPFDHYLYFNKCVTSIAPKVFIFGETEIWPNLLSYLKLKKVPSFLVNGRISDNTFKRYLKFKGAIADSLKQVDFIFAASEIAKERFIALGANEKNVSVVSNTKYDNQSTIQIDDQQKIALRSHLFESNSPIVVFSSIRPSEEEIIFQAIKSLETNSTPLTYIIAPRHAEKFSYFENKLREFNFDFDQRSKIKAPSKKRFLLLDTIGELNKLLPAADLAFVGGTFAKYGGHNPLEPASFGIPPVIGPFSSTVADIVESLRSNNASFEATTSQEIANILKLLASSDPQIRERGNRAKETAMSFSGCSKQIVEYIKKQITK